MPISYVQTTALNTAGSAGVGGNYYKEVTLTVAVGDRLVVWGASADANTTGTGDVQTSAGPGALDATGWVSILESHVTSNVGFVSAYGTVGTAGSITVRIDVQTASSSTNLGGGVWKIPAGEWSGTPTSVTLGPVSSSNGQITVNVPSTSNVMYAEADWTAADPGATTTPAGGTVDSEYGDTTTYGIGAYHWTAQASGSRPYGPSGLTGGKVVAFALAQPTSGTTSVAVTRSVSWNTNSTLIPVGVTRLSLWNVSANKAVTASAQWASGTPTTSGSTWTNTTNATGTNNATFATFTTASSGAVGYISLGGYGLQTAVGYQPDSITSVTVVVYGYVATTARWTSMTVGVWDGTTTQIGSNQTMTLSATTTNSQTFTFTGVTWANLANLNVRVTGTKGNTTSSTMNVDAVSVAVNYSVISVPTFRTLSWNTLATPTPVTRDISWNTLTNVTSPRSLLWNVLTPATSVAVSRILSWNTAARVSITRVMLWNTRSFASMLRVLSWNVLTPVSPTRVLSWTTNFMVPATRSMTWNVLTPTSTTRTLSWNVIGRVATSRSILWNTLANGWTSTVFGTGVPSGTQQADSTPYNFGTVIRCNDAGDITAIRFYVFTPHDPWTSTVSLYVDGTTTPVRTATFSGWVYPGTSQWVEVPITPYTVTAGQVVMAAYTINGYYTAQSSGLTSDITSADGHLTAPTSVTFNGTSGNGRFTTTTTAIPDQSFSNGNYFVDLKLVNGDGGIQSVAVSRSTSWNVTSQIPVARSSSWNTNSQLPVTRDVSWNTRVQVPITRSTSWNVSSTTSVGVSRLISWNTLAQVPITRVLSWNALAQAPPATRAISYKIASLVGTSRAMSWNTLSNLGFTTITFVGASSTTYSTRQFTDVPNPGNLAVDDLILVEYLVSHATSVTNPTVVPTGFSIFAGPVDNNDAGNFHVQSWIYGKWATAADAGASPTNTFWSWGQAGTSENTQAICQIYRGVDKTTPQDVAATSNVVGPNTGAGSTYVWKGLTTVTPGTMLVGFGHDWGDSAGNLTPPTGFIERNDLAISYGMDRLDSSTGATGDVTSPSNSAANNPNTTHTLALRPASTAATPVSITRVASWNTLSGTIASRAVSWNTRASVTAARSVSWNTLGSLTAVSTSRSVSWNTLASVTTTRIVSWNDAPGTLTDAYPGIAYPGNTYPGVVSATSVSISRTVSWNTAAPVTANRVVSWNVFGPIVATRAVSWNTRTSTATTRAVSWNVLTPSPMTRAISWNTRALSPAVTRQVSWNIRVYVAASRVVLWNTRSTVIASRVLLWRTLYGVTTASELYWDGSAWQSLAIATYTGTTWRPLTQSYWNGSAWV